MGRRSPVLGYNHNVRYRGVLFHVQTEDSGKLNPHLFTHLFHGGTIVSTRKLVYDPNADDGVVKSLMQAQHKAVMKELRRGLFDDKIDINLRGTPGLLPRGVDDGAVEETNVGAPPKPPPQSAEAQSAIDALLDPGSSPLIEIVEAPQEVDSDPAIEITADEPSPAEILLTPDEPSSPEITVTHHPNMTPPGTPTLDMSSDNTVPSSAPEMDRPRPYNTVPPLPPPPADASPSRTSTPGDGRRSSTPPPMSSASLPPIPPRTNPASTMRGAPPVPRQQQMSAPVVTTRPITRETPDRPRSDVSQAFDSITGMEDIAEIHSPAMGSAPQPPGANPTTAPSSASEYIHKRGDRSMRDDVRSQRMPVINDRNDRPSSQRIAVQDPRNADAPPEHRARPASGGIPVQRPGTEGSRPNQVTNTPGRRPSQHPEPPAAAPPRRPSQHPEPPAAATPGRRPSQHPEPPAKPPTPPESQLPRTGALPPPIPGRSPPPVVVAPSRGTPPDNAIPIPRTRTPTAPRPFSASPRQGAPATPPRARSGSGGGASGGGVVMSRPAVIVGARSQTPTPSPTPAAPAGAQGATPPEQPRTSTNSGARVRRAREEGGGRGVFGQDLISEKSLDEVILAYLSEDASEE